MRQFHFTVDYKKYVAGLIRQHDIDTAMALAVGGNYEATGILHAELLAMAGMKDGNYLIDIGCGSGRTAACLSRRTNIRYLGIDVVDDLIKYAIQKNPKHYRFAIADGLKIPEQNNTADFVTFFSVLTHLLHEESFQYLEEAARVLRTGGKVIASFLEFHIPSHWEVFAATVANSKADRPRPLNVFLDRKAIESFAAHLGFTVVSFLDGDKPTIPLRQEIIYDNGTRESGMGTFGQSVVILQKN